LLLNTQQDKRFASKQGVVDRHFSSVFQPFYNMLIASSL
jgi:hypothetical protein